jgi:uncharacterized membrane protein HdeD (DUF308 family)
LATVSIEIINNPVAAFLKLTGIILSILFIVYILNKGTKNNNTKLVMGVLLSIIGIILFMRAHNYHPELYMVIVLLSSFYVIIGIIGILKATVWKISEQRKG